MSQKFLFNNNSFEKISCKVFQNAHVMTLSPDSLRQIVCWGGSQDAVDHGGWRHLPGRL